jgi:hypothetical protein
MSGWKGELGLLLTVLLLSGREAGIRIGRRGKRREGRPDFGGGAGKRKGRSKEANGVGREGDCCSWADERKEWEMGSEEEADELRRSTRKKRQRWYAQRKRVSTA